MRSVVDTISTVTVTITITVPMMFPGQTCMLHILLADQEIEMCNMYWNMFSSVWQQCHRKQSWWSQGKDNVATWLQQFVADDVILAFCSGDAPFGTTLLIFRLLAMSACT
jgi:hypothetical protein